MECSDLTRFAGNIISTTIFMIIVAGIPGTLSVWNIYNCAAKTPKAEKLISTLTVFVGGFFYLFLLNFTFDQVGEWYEQSYNTQLHNIISSEYSWFFYVVIILGFIGYFVLLYVRADKLPPLISALSISFLICLNVFQIAYAIQIAENVNLFDCLLYVYHANILLLSARVIQRHMREMEEIFKNRLSSNEDHKKYRRIYNLINNMSKYSIMIFIVLFFIIALAEIVFVFLGQGLDAPIKAFTDTADWTFSKQIPPPPEVYDSHYLCTVAAGGHKKVVKPIRLGTRRNQTIIVNRQLCIANAFEELIHDRMPKFHRRIRNIYDKYGYPLSKKITTPTKADIIYYIMKPLEWIFLVVLYTFDVRPEQRIARQYRYIEPDKTNSRVTQA